MKSKQIKTIVLGGRGNASRDRSVDVKELSERLSISLIDGSLNLAGTIPVWLDPEKAIYTNGKSHFYWKAHLNRCPVILNRWSTGCPVHIYEIFSEEHLRSKFGLSDGDPVVLEISTEIIDGERDSSILNRLVWYLVWWRREQLAWQDGIYSGFLRHRVIRRMTRRVYQDSALTS